MTTRSSDARRLMSHLAPAKDWGPCRGFWATTYNLDSAFLETDLMPALLDLGAWDDRHWTSRITMEGELARLDTAALAVDARGYCGRPRSLRLDVVAARGAGAQKLHAKVVLVVYDQAVRLLVGSANLTPNGYRQNLEIAAALVATSAASREATLIREALSQMGDCLQPWLSESAEALRLAALAQLALPPADEHQPGEERQEWFVWSDRRRPLYRRFLDHWPSGEPLRRLSVVSPFWSEEEGSGPLAALLRGFTELGALVEEPEVLLVTSAWPAADQTYLPVLPSSYACCDFGRLGARCSAVAADPTVSREEAGRDDVLLTRPLHAKLVLAEGVQCSLAYLGSANFTHCGWGFAAPRAANIEAGLILRRTGAGRAELAAHVPTTSGPPVALLGTGAAPLQAPEPPKPECLWPDFLHDLRLEPSEQDPEVLELVAALDPLPPQRWWQLALLPPETGPADPAPGMALLDSVEARPASDGRYRRSLSADELSRLLRDQEVLVRWQECPQGCAFPLNVAFVARPQLPISPDGGRPSERMLLSYYQGRISYEDLFPQADQRHIVAGGWEEDMQAGVDTSQIQSYQMREFVEALEGLRQDLHCAGACERSMRLALLGEASPVALTKAIVEAMQGGRRTPTAGAFQLVEILRCLHELDGHGGCAAWLPHLQQARRLVRSQLEQLRAARPADLGVGTSFDRYAAAILAGVAPTEAE
ncbi:MAG: hypothetical protein ACYC63_00425 [Armatimonadota bacterium]